MKSYIITIFHVVVDPFAIPDSDESGDEHEHYNPNRRVGELPPSR